MGKRRKALSALQQACQMHEWHKPVLSEKRCIHCDLKWVTWAEHRIATLESDNAHMKRILDDTLDLDLVFTLAGITPEIRDIIIKAGGKVNYDKRRYTVYPPVGSTLNINGHLALPGGKTLYLIGDFTRQHDGSQLVTLKPRC